MATSLQAWQGLGMGQAGVPRLGSQGTLSSLRSTSVTLAGIWTSPRLQRGCCPQGLSPRSPYMYVRRRFSFLEKSHCVFQDLRPGLFSLMHICWTGPAGGGGSWGWAGGMGITGKHGEWCFCG